MPVVQEGRSGVAWIIDLSAAAQWLIARGAATENERPHDVSGFDPDTLPPSDRKAWYEAEFKKRQLQELDGELMRAADHERFLAEIIKTITSELERLPDLLERDAGIDGKAVTKCRDIIDDLRNAAYESIQSGIRERDAEAEALE